MQLVPRKGIFLINGNKEIEISSVVRSVTNAGSRKVFVYWKTYTNGNPNPMTPLPLKEFIHKFPDAFEWEY